MGIQIKQIAILASSMLTYCCMGDRKQTIAEAVPLIEWNSSLDSIADKDTVVGNDSGMDVDNSASYNMLQYLHVRDTSICSVVLFPGTTNFVAITYEEDPDFGECCFFSNKGRTECVLAKRAYGCGDRQFMYLFLRQCSKHHLDMYRHIVLPDDTLKTTNGCFLGMRADDFCAAYNISDTSQNGNEVVEYFGEDESECYVCKYVFKHGHATEISFGYEW